MSPGEGLRRLQERKQELLTTSEVQRRLVIHECAGVRERLQWLERTVTLARTAWPLCVLALPLWRLWSRRHESRPDGSWLARISRVVALARQVTQAWQHIKEARPGSDDPPTLPS